MKSPKAWQSRLARVGSEAAWVLAGQTIAFLGSFALIKILTEQLGALAYGRLALGMSVAGVLHMFLYGPIEQTALRYVSVYREQGRLGLLLELLRRAHQLTAGVVAIVGMALATIVHLAAGGEWSLLVVLGLLCGLAGGINSTLISLQTALRQRRSVAIFQAADVWVRLGLSLLAIEMIRNAAWTALLGFFLGTAVIAMAQLSTTFQNPLLKLQDAKDVSGTERQTAHAELLRYGAPYATFAAFSWISSYADRWLVLTFANEQSVGIYAALLQIAGAPITLFLGMTNQYLVPLIFDRAGAAQSRQQHVNSSRLLALASSVYVLGLLVIIATAAAFGHSIVELLTNAEFARHADLLWLLCTGLGLSSIGQLLVIKGLAQNRSREYTAAKAVQVAALLLSAPFMVVTFGMTGMGLTLCISGTAYLASVVITNRRYFNGAA